FQHIDGAEHAHNPMVSSLAGLIVWHARKVLISWQILFLGEVEARQENRNVTEQDSARHDGRGRIQERLPDLLAAVPRRVATELARRWLDRLGACREFAITHLRQLASVRQGVAALRR